MGRSSAGARCANDLTRARRSSASALGSRVQTALQTPACGQALGKAPSRRRLWARLYHFLLPVYRPPVGASRSFFRSKFKASKTPPSHGLTGLAAIKHVAKPARDCGMRSGCQNRFVDGPSKRAGHFRCWGDHKSRQRPALGTPWLARASARSLPGWPAWPLIQCQ